jgi:aldose 1-epimerase
MSSPLHVLENEFWRVGFLPQTGMSTAFAQIKVNGCWVDFMRPTPESDYDAPSKCSSFVTIPWSNRIKDAVFRFRGRSYMITSNCVDGTAIHGVARDYPWYVEDVDSRSLHATFTWTEAGAKRFPFPFTAQIKIRLDGRRFTTWTSVQNDGDVSMPAGFGHHPYFKRALTSSSDTVLLKIPCEGYFELEQKMPSSSPVAIEPRVDFRTLRPPGMQAIDDCLTERDFTEPIRFHYKESKTSVLLLADDTFKNVVLYVPEGEPFFAVEPVTNANDGFNLFERGIAGSGVFALGPGEQRGGVFTLVQEQEPR